jgi:hypothetical protein
VLDLQRDALLTAGVDERHLFEDHASGSRGDRAGLAKALAFTRRVDCLATFRRKSPPAITGNCRAVAPGDHHLVWPVGTGAGRGRLTAGGYMAGWAETKRPMLMRLHQPRPGAGRVPALPHVSRSRGSADPHHAAAVHTLRNQ